MKNLIAVPAILLTLLGKAQGVVNTVVVGSDTTTIEMVDHFGRVVLSESFSGKFSVELPHGCYLARYCVNGRRIHTELLVVPNGYWVMDKTIWANPLPLPTAPLFY